MYEHDDVIDGEGPAYDMIVSAVNDRGVTDIAIMGYSWGGGDTYDLAELLQQNKNGTVTDITQPFGIAFTGYIDAISTGTLFAETRRPPLSAFHCNQWETNTPLPHGAYSDGDTDEDRSSLGLTHLSIDDDVPTVLTTLQSDLRANVSP